jgi:L-amino acid N-acyltransferase YncA
MSAYRVRLAQEADAEAICRIYNQGIEDRVATLETELRTAEERRDWIRQRSPRHPVIVAELAEPDTARARPPTERPDLTAPATRAADGPPTERGGVQAPGPVIGWGSLNVFNPRAAYRFVADFSVYVERAWRGKGVGSVLLARLIELARQHGFHKMVLSAFPTNKSGIALYEAFGFRTVGMYREQGLLDGQWVDTVVMEKLL